MGAFRDNEIVGSAHGAGKGELTEWDGEWAGSCRSWGIVVDLAHASPQAIDHMLDVAILSHTGVKASACCVFRFPDKCGV